MIIFKINILHSKKILYKFYELETNHQQKRYLISSRYDGYIDKNNIFFDGYDKIFENRLRRIQGAEEDIL